jgi:hypothetical protein
MNKSNVMGQVGFWAFIVGLVVALIAGIVAPANSVVAIILLVLGVIVGFLNITAKEITLFLVAAIALILVGNAFAVITIGDIGKFIGQILAYIATFVAPAAIIAAIKALWAVGKPGD